MSRSDSPIIVRNTRLEDFPEIIELTRAVYPESPPWNEAQLTSHLKQFPEGQFVALHPETGKVAGMASSLIVLWDDYNMKSSWRDFTDHGMFTNHDPVRGHTLYAAEVMVHPEAQGRGLGSRIYEARRELTQKLGLLRIRAGARLRGYSRYADRMGAEEYVEKVVLGEIGDPTLSFQLRHGFRVLAVVPEYLRHDEESRGNAAVIEWLNPDRVKPEDAAGRDPRFEPHGKTPH